jgi:hypothetical protein
MIWFHTVALPLATLVAVLIAVKRKSPWWKYVALAAGCALMLAGLWGPDRFSTVLLLGGGVVFLFGVPRRLPQPRPAT